MKFHIRLLSAAVFAVFIFTLPPQIALANSAEPPAVIVIANNAPNDLTMEVQTESGLISPDVNKAAWETYYVFYYYGRKYEPSALIVSTGSDSKTYELGALKQTYNNVFTLDVAKGTLKEGTLPYRSAILVALRLTLTLLIEGALFYLFGFRKKASWLAFLIINLITQGVLNWALSTGSIIGGYRIFGLILMEILVLAIEIPAVIIGIKEHKKGRRALFALAANILSFIAGGLMITLLPV